MKYIMLRQFQIVKYVQFFFLAAIITLSNTAYAALTVTVEPNNRGIISFLSECNIVLSIGSDAEIDLSKLLIKLNGDDVTKEIRGLGKAILSGDKKKLNISYPANASDFHQGEYTFEVSTTGATGDKATLNIQEYKGKAICVNCDSSSRSLSEADLNQIIEEETRAVKKTPPKPKKVDGKCGSSNAASFDKKPSSNLCTSGTKTNVTGSETWTWKCNGDKGGKNAVCSANNLGYNCVAYVKSITPWLKNSGLDLTHMSQKVNAIDEHNRMNAQPGYIGVQEICNKNKLDNGIGHLFKIVTVDRTKAPISITLTVTEANFKAGIISPNNKITITANDKGCGSINGYICDWGKHGKK